MLYMVSYLLNAKYITLKIFLNVTHYFNNYKGNRFLFINHKMCIYTFKIILQIKKVTLSILLYSYIDLVTLSYNI